MNKNLFRFKVCFEQELIRETNKRLIETAYTAINNGLVKAELIRHIQNGKQEEKSKKN